jgi:hypothetical protein
MSVTIIREIEKLSRNVSTKYASLMSRVSQLESNFTDVAQVTDVVALITGLDTSLGFTVLPDYAATPYYTFPTQD